MRSIFIIYFTFLCFITYCQSYQFKQGDRYIVKVDALDYAFALPDTIPSGWITFRMINKGMDTHMAYIGRKPDSLTTNDFMAMVYNPNIHYEGIGHGGPGLHSPGISSETTLHLEPGEYFIGCGAITEKGIKHSQLGMVRYFHVSSQHAGTSAPKADGTIRITKFTIYHDLPAEGGRKTLKIIHEGDDANLHLIKFDTESSRRAAESYLTNLTDPTPAKMLGGTEQAQKGKEIYVTLDLKAGDYSWMAYYGFPWGVDAPFTINYSGKIETKNNSLISKIPVELKISSKGCYISKNIQTGIHPITISPSDLKSHSPVLFRLREGITPGVFEDYIKNFHLALVRSEKDKVENLLASKPWVGKEIQINKLDSPDLKVTFPKGNFAFYCMHALSDPKAHFHKEAPVFFEVK